MKIKPHHILLACLGLLLSASAASGRGGSWDEDAARRKAAYIFIDAMADLSDESYTAYSAKLRRATQLDPSDVDIAAEYAELLLQTTELDSAETMRAYNAMWRRFKAAPGDYTTAAAMAEIAGRMGRLDDVAEVWKALRKALPGRNDPR